MVIDEKEIEELEKSLAEKQAYRNTTEYKDKVIENNRLWKICNEKVWAYIRSKPYLKKITKDKWHFTDFGYSILGNAKSKEGITISSLCSKGHPLKLYVLSTMHKDEEVFVHHFSP